MNRTYKFRAWDPVEKKMYSPKDLFNSSAILIDNNPEGEIGIYVILDPEGSQRYFSIQQYTGVKDRVGNEIYEGDTVEYYRVSTFTGDMMEPIPGEVKWNERIAGFEISISNGSEDLSLPARFVKTGNIYE